MFINHWGSHFLCLLLLLSEVGQSNIKTACPAITKGSHSLCFLLQLSLVGQSNTKIACPATTKGSHSLCLLLPLSLVGQSNTKIACPAITKGSHSLCLLLVCYSCQWRVELARSSNHWGSHTLWLLSVMSQMGESKTSMSFSHCQWCHRWEKVKLTYPSITVDGVTNG